MVLHWDGKLLPEITGNDKVDRLPIVVSQENTEQLLAVPKLSSGTGYEISSAVFEQINNWQLKDKVQAICFDTTSTNTGQTNGAAVLLEKLLKRSLLYLPCRHHIYELILKYVFLQKILKSSTVGPDIPLLNRFKQSWHTMDQSFFNFGVTDSTIQKHITPLHAKEITNFCLEQLTKDIHRDDYKEFLELVVLFLGHSLPDGNKFKRPGASHHARWMSKAIYALKIFMFRDQFELLQEEKDGLRDVCLFLVLIYVRAWFGSNQSIEAANNDIQLIKTSIAYKKIDRVTSEIILDKIGNHLWYLGSEVIGMSFFDSRVPDREKRKMVIALNIQKEQCKRFVIQRKNIEQSFTSKNLSDFVS